MVRTEQFWDLGRRDRRQDYNQKWNAGDPCEEADQNQQAARNLEGSDEMRGEIRVREANLREAQDADVKINVFEETLG